MRMLCTILLVDGILQSTEEPLRLAVYDRIVSSWLDFPVQLSSSCRALSIWVQRQRTDELLSLAHTHQPTTRASPRTTTISASLTKKHAAEESLLNAVSVTHIICFLIAFGPWWRAVDRDALVSVSGSAPSQFDPIKSAT
jgi:hypothetical protein